MIRFLLQRVSLLALAASLIVPAAFAQNQPQPEQPQPQQSNIDVSDEEVKKVAELFVEIGEVRKKYRPRLRKAEGSEKARAIQQEMRSDINQTIDEFEGLSSERYDQITQAAQADEELKNRILTQVKKEREEQQKSGD